MVFIKHSPCNIHLLHSYFTAIVGDDVDLSDIHLVVFVHNVLHCLFIGY